jgi:hypothetical protein
MDFSVNNNSSSSSISTTNISDDYNYSGSDGDVRLRYDYAMHIDNDLPRSIPCTVQPFTTTSSTDAAVNIEEIGHLTTHYTVAELFSGTDDWHVLDRTEDNRYMLIYYCGTGELSPDKYQGAVVMIKDGWQLSDVPGTILDRFTNVLHGAGLSQLDTRQFCVNHLNHC